MLAVLAAMLTGMVMPSNVVSDDPQFENLVATDAEVRLLHGGFRFLEGPVWVDGKLVFSDIPADMMFVWSAEAGVGEFRKPSFHANGNTLDLQGNLITCEHGSRLVSVTVDDERHVLVERIGGKRFNSPNDAVVRSDGTVWFTDPPFGLPRGKKAELMELDGSYIYCLDPNDGAIAKVGQVDDTPNGLCFSPDERRLYVADTGANNIVVFEVHGHKLMNPRVFTEIDRGTPDGMRCDEHGNVWCTAGDGVHVFSPDGKRLGKVLVPETPANCAFGGEDGRTLFITARTGLYAVETKVTGAQRPVVPER